MTTEWEYKLKRDLDISEVSKLGSEGWELASTILEPQPHGYSQLFYFKRPVAQLEAPYPPVFARKRLGADV